jgi:hypothetical protein
MAKMGINKCENVQEVWYSFLIHYTNIQFADTSAADRNLTEDI